MEERPFVRCLEESWALKGESEGQDGGSLAEAGLAYGGGAGHPEGGQAPSVSAVGDDWGKTGFTGQDGGRGREKVVRCPSLDPVPEANQASEGGEIRGEEVGSIRQYGEE